VKWFSNDKGYVLISIPALGAWTMYLPGAAANALTQVAQGDQDYLAPWQGGLVLAGYGSRSPPRARCCRCEGT
jgi:hypothetical protein